MTSYVVKRAIKIIFDLVSVDWGVLAGAMSHILAPRHAKRIKLIIIA